MAHEPNADGKFPSIIGAPHAFEPHGPFEFDSYYCGCRGWDWLHLMSDEWEPREDVI